MDEVWLHLALVGAGVFAGFINSIAGGGSLLTLPVLMLLGLPANMANGTNRISVLTTSITGVIGFRRHGVHDRRALVPVVAPTVAGAALGALFAAQVPAAILKYVLLGTMVTMAAVMVVRPRAALAPEGSEPIYESRRALGAVSLFAVGLYGGFVQAGVGILLLGVLSGVLRYDLLRANALKLACVAVFGAVALGIFIAAGQVVWLPGCLLAVYTVIGTYVGVRFAMRVSQDVIRWIVFVCVVATCAAALIRG